VCESNSFNSSPELYLLTCVNSSLMIGVTCTMMTFKPYTFCLKNTKRKSLHVNFKIKHNVSHNFPTARLTYLTMGNEECVNMTLLWLRYKAGLTRSTPLSPPRSLLDPSSIWRLKVTMQHKVHSKPSLLFCSLFCSNFGRAWRRRVEGDCTKICRYSIQCIRL